MKRLFLVSVAILIAFLCRASVFSQSDNDVGQEPEKDRGVQIEMRPHPEEAKEEVRGSKGIVRLRVIFRASGEVEVVKVLEVNPKNLPKEVADDLVQKSIEAARKIKFKPAVKNGRRVSQYATLEYNFWDDEEEKSERK